MVRDKVDRQKDSVGRRKDSIDRQKDSTFFRPTTFGPLRPRSPSRAAAPDGQRLNRVLSTGHPSTATCPAHSRAILPFAEPAPPPPTPHASP